MNDDILSGDFSSSLPEPVLITFQAGQPQLMSITSNWCSIIFAASIYGLVEADRIARASNQEKESLKTMLLVKLRNKNIEKYLNASNAHEILDRISF